MMTNDEILMREALRQAQLAAEEGEVPVGAVVALDGEIISVGRNRRETVKNALAHAEIEAIDAACRKLGGWRLHKCELFVTLEPCPMCMGAIINTRIKRLVYGAFDPKNGACGSVADLSEMSFTHSLPVEKGFLAEECAAELKSFFKKLRESKPKDIQQ